MTASSIASPYIDKPDPWSSHSVIARWLEVLPRGSRVLDVGTATGTLGRMCQHLGLVMHGIEPSPEWAEIARPFYSQIHVSFIEQTPNDFLRAHAAVICADILEHTPRPEEVLRRLTELQDIGALFFISVPNIANIYIRLSLLFGKFNYADRGILDRTHLRFFTRNTIVALIQQAGLEVLEIRVTPIPLDLVFTSLRRHVLGRFIYSLLKNASILFPTLLGYQFVIKARKT